MPVCVVPYDRRDPVPARRLLVDQGIIVRVATNLVANSAGSELVGRLVAPLFNQGVEALGYYACRRRPIRWS